MSGIDEQLLEQVRAHEHYRKTDYNALADRLGREVVEERLRVQMDTYEKSHHFQSRPLLKYIRPLYRLGVRSGLWAMGQYAKAKHSARSPRWIEREEWFPSLPEAFDGFRVLHLTDFHFDFIPELPEIVEAALKGHSWDLCVLTGDYRGEILGPFEDSLRYFQQTRPFLGESVTAVLGNHDNIDFLSSFPDMGITGLLNEAYELERDGASILVAGVDDAHTYRTHDFRPIQDKIDQAAFTLLLSHSPEACQGAADAGVDFMLSGHTHGGQICLPGGWAPIVHLHDTPRDKGSGAWTCGSLKGYTSHGVGISTVDCRWNCPGEITLHTLRRGEKR